MKSATFALNFTEWKHFEWMRSLNINYLFRFRELKTSNPTIVLLLLFLLLVVDVNIWIRISYCMACMTHLLIFTIIIKMTFFRLFEFVTMLKFRSPFIVYCLPQLIWMMMHRFHFIANKIYMIFVSFLFWLTVKMTVFSRKTNSFICAMSD